MGRPLGSKNKPKVGVEGARVTKACVRGQPPKAASISVQTRSQSRRSAGALPKRNRHVKALVDDVAEASGSDSSGGSHSTEVGGRA